MTPSLTIEQIEQLARKRAGAKLGWFIHALVYALVNSGLVLMALAAGKTWAAFPLLGWGLGLGIHGAVVWWAGAGSTWHNKLLARERERLLLLRDPW